MITARNFGRRRFEVPCTVEIEHTAESLHAHVELDGVVVEPGDQVTVHAAPVDVPFGERIVVRRTATVVRAGAAERVFTKVIAYLELTELYEVGFSPRS
jgi:hypothetical protein